MKIKAFNFNFEKIGKNYFISNDFGNWEIMSSADFERFKKGGIPEKSKLFKKLTNDGFFSQRLDFENLIKNMRKLSPLKSAGPSLHILVLTLRCNHHCVYCRAVSNGPFKNTDMTFETAKKSVDTALSSPNGNVSLEFQGGEALMNWKVFKKAVVYAKKKNKKSGKDLNISLVTNFSLMNEEKFRFIDNERISVCSSLDGPEKIHNANRIYAGRSSYALTAKWLEKFMAAALKRKGKKDSLPSALMTTTKISLDFPKEIVDEYRKFNLGGIFIRPLSPVGCAKDIFDSLGYKAEDFIVFYENVLDYILDINFKGEKFIERNAAIILKKLLLKKDPDFLDLRSPCGAAVGQLAYDWNGGIYTCDEGRMLGANSDFTFKLGDVSENSYDELIKAPAAKLCAMTSCLENQPECFRCAFKPYCGVCPVHNMEAQNSPWGNIKGSYWCGVEKGIFKAVLKRLRSRKNREVFESWFE